MIPTLTNLIPICRRSTGNSMLGQQVSSKIINPLDSAISNIHTPRNWTIMALIEVLRLVVPGQGLLCLEGAGPGATGS